MDRMALLTRPPPRAERNAGMNEDLSERRDRPAGTRPRIVDIARAAGVSTATVDRVLNDRKGVRGPTAERVIRIATQLNYLSGEGTAIPAAPERRCIDFILPAGPNTFMDLFAQAVQEVPQTLSGPGAGPPVAARCHRIEGFDPSALAESLLRIGASSDGVAFVALDHPQVREAVNTLVEAGTPVVTVVSDIANSRRLGYVGIDNRAAGRTAGYLLGRLSGGRRGKVAMIAGSLSYRGHEEREMGFRHILAEEFPELEIVGLREGRDDFNANLVQARELLEQVPDLLGIYNIGGGSRGVGQALIETGRAREILFVGHELTTFTRRFLIDGVMDAVINQNPHQEVAGSIRMLLDHHARRDSMTDTDRARIEIFVRENLP
jgi:LacI family transcriptional regulator